MTLVKTYPIFPVAFKSTIEEVHTYNVILIQPLHHERLKPPADTTWAFIL